jgi:osmotically-inducible protein OsmY
LARIDWNCGRNQLHRKSRRSRGHRNHREILEDEHAFQRHGLALNDVVYLSGGVSEGTMRETAESVALKVKGVARVEDTIYVTK